MTKDLKSSLAWGGGIIAVALAATLARRTGVIDADAVTRIVLGVIGLMVAWYGNRMPKTLAPNEINRQVTRVGGWSMALSGLLYAGLWAFAPLDVALIAGCGAILVGMAVTFGYCVALRNRTRAA